MAIEILVVDDEPDLEALVIQTFRHEIKDKKFNFLFAKDGLEAIKRLEENPEIVLILTDINMPRMNGLELLKKISEMQDEISYNLIRKVVIISAYGDMANIREAMNQSAFDFLTKPIDLKDLKITVEKTLGEIEKIKNHISEKKKFQQEREMLARYFSNDIVEKILREDYHNKMIGGNEVATILFLDIRNFTAISENLKPDMVADLLNKIYPDLMELILSNGGSVNKLIGDAIVATFGLPTGTSSDAYNAVKTSREIVNWVAMFSKVKPEYVGEHDIKVGIGITTGEVFAGNIGSFRRMEYTVIGDIVNTASRLQNLTKKVGVDILIDGKTKEKLGDLVSTRHVRVKSIRGKSERVEIFTVDDLKTKKDESEVNYF